MIQIYRAEKEDAAAVEACCEKAFEAYISLIGKKPAPMHYDYAEEITEHAVFVASDGKEIQGFVLMKDGEADYMWLDVLAVNPASSGNGIGRALIAYGEDYILQNGKKECRLYTNVKFERTCNIYRKLGYEIYDKVCVEGYERYYMKRNLAGVSPVE